MLKKGFSPSQIHMHSSKVVDHELFTTTRGLYAIKWSFLGLIITALFQISIAWISGSIALFADTIHNFGDAATAIPLGFAFPLSRKRPDKRFTYGYGSAEDLAGLAIIFFNSPQCSFFSLRILP